MTLHNLQKDFINYIKTNEVSELIDAEIKSDSITNENKLDVYKNNVFTNASNALRINYPYLLKLIGDDFFDKAAAKYVEHKLPESGSLAEYGDEFSNFLKTIDNISGYEFIPDFARIEWAIYSVGTMDIEEILMANTLAAKLERGIPFEIGISNCSQVMTSEYNLKYIYELLDSDSDSEVEHSKLNVESNYLIRKADDGVKTFLLNQNEFWVINSVKNGTKFQAVIETIGSEEEASSIVARLLNFKIIKEIK